MMGLRLLPGATLFTAVTLTSTVSAEVRAPVTPEALVTAAKQAAGADHAGTFLRPRHPDLNAGAWWRRARPAPCPTAPPVREALRLTTPFHRTRIHSAWARLRAQGLVVIDTLFDYAIEPEMIEGLTTLGLDPRDIVRADQLCPRDHDHVRCCRACQDRWCRRLDTTQRATSAPGGAETRHAVGRDGLKFTLGDHDVATPAIRRHVVYSSQRTGRTVIVAYPRHRSTSCAGRRRSGSIATASGR